mmetsp:Transcript_24884/g.23898  ORF Transcript_24884/g.23898 Transcript_24884/m.23898 type:complete len:95 (+) Transcript_24884:68-352(+)
MTMMNPLTVFALRYSNPSMRTYGAARAFSSSKVAARPNKIGGFFQRLTSFIAGASVTALGTQYFIYQEIQEGNKSVLAKQKNLEKRIEQIEGKR